MMKIRNAFRAPLCVTVERYRKNDLEKIKTDRFPGNISTAINEMGTETSKYRKDTNPC